MAASSVVVNIPSGAGYVVTGHRETSQANQQGQIEQGQVFTLQLATGGTTSVFIPNSLLGATDAISAAFAQRVAQLNAILSLGSTPQ